jgi:anti-sigma factor RsiW
MIHQHLQRSAMIAPPMLSGLHLDEDALSAFVEGRLSEAESAPVVSHLVACGFCRRITAQLVRLEAETSAAEVETPAAPAEPGRIRRLLQNLAERVIPPADEAAVFAYHAPADDLKRKTEEDTSEESAAQESRPEDQSDPEPSK